jgi:hypothetical protein
MTGRRASHWLVVALLPCAGLAQEPEGFIGFRWGTPLAEVREKLELVQVREDGRYALFEVGKVPFAGMELRDCGLEFVDGRLAGGFCQTTGRDESLRLKLSLERQLGKPLTNRPMSAQWSGRETFADYDEDELGNAYLYEYSRRLNEFVPKDH